MRTTTYLLLILATLASSTALARDKTDVIVLLNGDRFTGEIKQLQHGKLQVSTDSLGTVLVEWEDIARIESDHQFQFERTDGTRVTGTVLESSASRKIELLAGPQKVSFAHENVVRISQIEDTFWDRLQGSLTFGYSFTKASEVAQGNLGIRATHRTEQRAFSLDASTIITSDQDSDNTKRANISLNTTRFRSNRWFNSYLTGFESNDELGLDLRTSLGASMGRYLVQTNTSEFAVLGGLVGTAEDLNPSAGGPENPSGESSEKSVEGLLGLNYSRYIFNDPTVDLSIRLSLFPSITQRGRTRGQFDVNLRWELINNLFWELDFYDSYDSDPPSGSESTSDYGVVTSIGYSF